MELSSLKPRRGEVKEYLLLAIPIVVSNASEAIMLFCDRLFLSMYRSGSGSAYLNASLVGGLTAFMIFSFFIATAGYSKAIIAQYVGAKQPHVCAQVTEQAILFSFIAYPIMLVMLFFVDDIFAFFQHSPLQTFLETRYCRILLLGSVLVVLSNSFGSFFIGVGKSRRVMLANLIGMTVNIPMNYLLIFGIGGFPELGIDGAAIATIIGTSTTMTILALSYYSDKIHKIYGTRKMLKFRFPIFKKIIKYGTPNGFEILLGVAVFDFFIMIMNAYGEVVGSAVAIAINWDGMMFIPMLGASFATTSLVGRHIGAKDIQAVRRTTALSLMVMLSYALVVVFVLVTFTESLMNPFLSKMSNADEVRPLAFIMLRLASLYLLADAANLTFSGTLNGTGDTHAVMYIFIVQYIVFGTLLYFFSLNEILSPLGTWYVFIGFAVSLGVSMIIRYHGKKWQHKSLVSN